MPTTKDDPHPAQHDDLVAPPQDPHLKDGKHVLPHFGPYAGTVLVMPIAEADQAIADKWATALPHPIPDASDELPPPLTPEERAAAEDAADVWAAAARGEPHPAHPEGQHAKDKDARAQAHTESRAAAPAAAKPAAAPAPRASR